MGVRHLHPRPQQFAVASVGLAYVRRITVIFVL